MRFDNVESLCAALREAKAEVNRLAPDAPKWQQDQQWKKEEAIQTQAAKIFGERYGWKLTDKRFDLETLSRRGKIIRRPCFMLQHVDGCFDHDHHYTVDGYAAAVASHVYNDRSRHKESRDQIAVEYGLRWELISDFPSWHYVGSTKLILWRPAN